MKTLDTALPRTPFAALTETVQAPRSRASRVASVSVSSGSHAATSGRECTSSVGSTSNA